MHILGTKRHLAEEGPLRLTRYNRAIPRLAARVASALIAGAFGAGCDPTSSNDAAPSGIPSAALQEGKHQVAQWANIQRLLKSHPERFEEPCDDKAIRERHAGAPGRVLVVDAGYLARFSAPYSSPYEGSEAAWALLTDSRLRSLDPRSLQKSGPSFADALLAARELSQFADYWGVVETSERHLPIVDASGYSAGSISGWLLVVDPRTPEILCQAAIAAASSDEVARSSRTTAETAIRRDFSIQIHRELDASLRRISRQLALISE